MDNPPRNGRNWPPAGDDRGWPSRPGTARSGRGDDGWSPSTAVYSASYNEGGPGGANGRGTVAPPVPVPPRRDSGRRTQPNGRDERSRADDGSDWARDAVRGRNSGWTRDAQRERDGDRRRNGDDDWSPAGPAPARQQRATRAADRRAQDRMEQSVRALRTGTPGRPERGTRWWPALLVLIVIAVLGGIIDVLTSVQGGFNVAIVIASVVAIVMVRRSHMFPIVIAPPIVYSVGAVFQLYIRSNGLSNKSVVLDAAANYLVYGFPAIATATAAVLIIAGIRLIARR